MGKKLILAVAGAGKTYSICHYIDPSKRNLILAFTNQNINNIKSELIDAWGTIPDKTYVSTFDSFVHKYCLMPYEPSIKKSFGVEIKTHKKLTFKEPPSKQIKTSNNRYIRNPKYKTKDEFEHYCDDGYYYCSTMTELLLNSKDSNKKKLINRILKNINQFFDQVMIDEFQDFREKNFDFLIALSKNMNNITFVGDYFQHSVSGKNNSGKPFKNVNYDDFLKKMKGYKFEVDTSTLSKSRRCSKDVCDFISKKLNIPIKSEGLNEGKVIMLNDMTEIKKVLYNDSIVKLVYQEANKYNFNSINWSYSKGDTYSCTCVILIPAYDNINDIEFSPTSNITLNSLYVAITRSEGNVYLVKNKDFKKIKDYFLY